MAFSLFKTLTMQQTMLSNAIDISRMHSKQMEMDFSGDFLRDDFEHPKQVVLKILIQF
jgi:hypothetical protein